MSDAGTRLRALLDDLEDSRITLGEAAARLRDLPLHAAPPPGPYQVLHRQAVGDPQLPPDHSFHEVQADYTEGKLTRFQYETLAEAALQAMGSQRGTASGDHAPGSPLPP